MTSNVDPGSGKIAVTPAPCAREFWDVLEIAISSVFSTAEYRLEIPVIRRVLSSPPVYICGSAGGEEKAQHHASIGLWMLASVRDSGVERRFESRGTLYGLSSGVPVLSKRVRVQLTRPSACAALWLPSHSKLRTPRNPSW